MTTIPDRTRTRILYFVPPSKHFAGIERVVHEIADGLMSEHGDHLDVHVIFGARYDEPLLVGTRYGLHVLDTSRLRELPAKLRRAVREISPDMVVFPQVEASVLGWVATRGLGVPVFIAHLHGNPRLEEAEGTFRTRASFLAFRHVVSRNIAAVLAVSPSLARYAGGALSRHAPVEFAKNPVRDFGAVPRPERNDGQLRFVSVARLSRQKGQDIVLRALSIARSQLPHARLTLVGNGPDEVELRALAVELGVDDLVEFTGYVSDPRPYLRDADCFLLASRWEGFGVALVEALQFGLPVLSTDCDFGPSDLIDDPRLGEVVASDDPEAFAAGMVRAAQSPRDPLTERYRVEVAARYLPVAATAAHHDIIVRLAGRFSKRSARLARLGQAAGEARR
jgi:glycosyltransferase involved in cell wall biosynthesis